MDNAKKYTRPKYSLEIETDKTECTAFVGSYAGWLNYDTIYAEGNSLQECLDDAEVSLQDQDGGNPKFIEADEDWMQDLIVTEFNKKYGGE